jgi:hypothetical protein
MTNETLLTNIAGLVPEIKAEALMILQDTAGILDTVRIVDAANAPGSTVDFPVFGTVTSSDVATKTEGTASTTNKQITNAAVQAVVQEKFIATFVSWLALKSASGDLVRDVSQLFASAIRAKLEDDIVSLASGFSNTLAGAGTTLTLDHIFLAKSGLKSANSPSEIYAVVSPKQYWGAKGLRAIVTDADADSGVLGEEYKAKGFLSDAFGIKWLVSNEIDEDVASGDDAAGLIYAKGAIGLGHKGIFDIVPDNVIRNLGVDLVGYGYWRAVEIYDSWGRYLLTDVS